MSKLQESILELGELAKRPHFSVDEDNWYSCPKAPEGCCDDTVGTECNCGADAHNEKVDELIKRCIVLTKWEKILEIDSIPEGWFEKLERAALREQGRRNFYEKNYADKMTYDRFVYCQYLENEILWGHSCDERAIELLNKYDEQNPTERFDQS